MRVMPGFAAAAAGLVLSAALSVVFAQQSPPVRVRGQIEKVDGNMLTIKARDGVSLTVKLADNARVLGLNKASLGDIKQGTYIGVTAMPQPDGSQKAVAIHLFNEAQRTSVPDGHRPWDLRPGSTMTNANVDTVVGGVDGQVVTVKYKDGEKKVVVAPDTAIVAVANEPGSKDELKPGAQIIIMGAQKQPDGTLTTPAIYVGRGVTPPM
jgi:hypothetical protein